MPAKKDTAVKAKPRVLKKSTKTTKPAEKASEVKVDREHRAAKKPVITLTERAEREIGDSAGMIAAGGVEVIGLLGLVTLIYATVLLYLMA